MKSSSYTDEIYFKDNILTNRAESETSNINPINSIKTSSNLRELLNEKIILSPFDNNNNDQNRFNNIKRSLSSVTMTSSSTINNDNNNTLTPFNTFPNSLPPPSRSPTFYTNDYPQTTGLPASVPMMTPSLATMNNKNIHFDDINDINYHNKHFININEMKQRKPLLSSANSSSLSPSPSSQSSSNSMISLLNSNNNHYNPHHNHHHHLLLPPLPQQSQLQSQQQNTFINGNH
jgi:hypothetical protein